MIRPSLFLKSIRFACRGFVYTFRYEQNFRIQLFIAGVVLAAMFFFRVSVWEAIALILTMMFVLVLELLNTMIEKVVDITKPRLHDYARVVKDIMATAVLLSSLAAIAIGVLIFLPYVETLFFQP